MQRQIVRRSVLAVILAVLTAGASSCGLFETEPGLYFNSGALQSGRLFLATHPVESLGTDLSLYSLSLGGSRSFSVYASGVGDPASPHVADRSQGGWFLAYGRDRLTVRSSLGDVEVTVGGRGARQTAAALHPGGSGGLVFMDGSAAAGYDISYRAAPGGATVPITDDASPARTYWTPSWSSDGQWILYARIEGATGAEAQLWRVHADGSGAEQLPFVTTELPTYAVFSPDGSEVFVPGDFTSYRVSNGTPAAMDHIRTSQDFLDQLAAMGYEPVGSALTGPTHPGEETTAFRHTFPIRAYWTEGINDRIVFDALVAYSAGDPPHEIAGAAVFSWVAGTRTLLQHSEPVSFPDSFTEGWSLSILHPTVIP